MMVKRYAVGIRANAVCWLVLAFICFAPPNQVAAQDDESAESKLEQADNLHKQGRSQEAFEIYRELAKGGNLDAMHLMSSRYGLYGDLLSDDDVIKWLSRAAAGGHALANYELGYRYQFGNLFPEDPDRSLKHFHAAARYGISLAYIEIIKLKGRGYDVPDAIAEESFKALDRISREGTELTLMSRYADLLGSGKGVEKDPDAAAVLYQGVIDTPDAKNPDGSDHKDARYNARVKLGRLLEEEGATYEELQRAQALYADAVHPDLCAQRTMTASREWHCSAFTDLERVSKNLQQRYCDVGFEEDPVSNVHRLFECNQTRAITHFSQDRSFLIVPDDISVTDGRMVVKSSARDEVWQKAIDVAQRICEGTDQCGAPEGAPITGEVICLIDLSDAEAIKQGVRQSVDGTLLEASGQSLVFDCSPG